MLIQLSSYMAMMAAIMATYNWFNPQQDSLDLAGSKGTVQTYNDDIKNIIVISSFTLGLFVNNTENWIDFEKLLM